MDMLVKLYGPWLDGGGPHRIHDAAVVVRKPIGAEHTTVVDWIEAQFGRGWASEASVALANRPVSLWLASTGSELAGFACYDATARGFFGPIGVAESARGRGIGAALLRACLLDMRTSGYGYAIVGGVGAPDFFSRLAGAVEISDSTPGIYADQLRSSVLGTPRRS